MTNTENDGHELLTRVLAEHCYHNMEFAGAPGGRWSAECNCDEILFGNSHDEAERALAAHQAEAVAAVDLRPLLAAAWAEGHGVGRTDEWGIEPNPYWEPA